MKVSVLIPCFNCETYIKDCLNSVINQTYQDLEIIVIDDCSSDNTSKILFQYAEQDKRIRVHIHNENKGVAATRNELLSLATGVFVEFVDSDDWIEHDLIENMLFQLSEEVDIVMCSIDIVTNDSTVIKTQAKKDIVFNSTEEAVKDFLTREYSGSLCDKLIRRNIIQGLLFDTSLTNGEDVDFVWRLLNQARRIVSLSKVGYHYRQVATSITHSFNKTQFGQILVWSNIEHEVQKMYPDLKIHASTRLAKRAVYCLTLMYRAGYKDKKAEIELNNMIKSHLRSNSLDYANMSRYCRLFILISSFNRHLGKMAILLNKCFKHESD